jgi:ATP-dependent protease ClpP protease subunit
MARINKDHIDKFYDCNIELNSRTLYIGYGEDKDFDLDQKVTADILKGLHILTTSSKELPIFIILNNQGGDTIHGLAIYDAIRSLPNHVTITVYGHCYSIGAWILQAADTRKMAKHSAIMIHHGEGEKTQFDKELDNKCVDILLNRIREKNPDYTKKQLDKLLLKDTYMWGEEALKLGLIDEVGE